MLQWANIRPANEPVVLAIDLFEHCAKLPPDEFHAVTHHFKCATANDIATIFVTKAKRACNALTTVRPDGNRSLQT